MKQTKDHELIDKEKISLNRRKLLSLGLVAAGGLVTSVSAKAICRDTTPPQPEGPFYPVDDQADKDTDLTYVRGGRAKAHGQVIIVEGQVIDQTCTPVQGALVEIWQACHTGKYNHPSDPNTAALDPNFQYWGRAVTGVDGSYSFKTILPGAYPAGEGWIRPPHIHFKVQKLGYIELITQMYFAGDDLNDRDLILNRLSSGERNNVVVPLVSKTNQKHPVAHFNINLEKI